MKWLAFFASVVMVGWATCAADDLLPSIEALGKALANPTFPNGAPQFPIPVRPPIFEYEGKLPTAQLLGFDLAQHGAPVAGGVPSLQVGEPIEITLYWRPISRLVETTRIGVNIRDEGVGPAPGFFKTYPIEITPWRFGEIRTQRILLDMPTGQFVGDGVLSFFLTWEGANWKDWAYLYRGPVRVPAVLWPSKLDAERLTELFGNGAERLDAAFRLAPGAELGIDVPGSRGGPISAIGLVSCVSWTSDFAQGAPICRIQCVDGATGEAQDVEVQCGVSTALERYDLYPTGALKSNKIDIAYSEERTDSETKKLYAAHRYISRVALPASMRPTRLVFTYMADAGVLDVEGLALLPEGAP